MNIEDTGISPAQIHEESKKVMTNVFLARNERTVKAQVRLSMPTPFIVCLEVVKIIKRSGANE